MPQTRLNWARKADASIEISTKIAGLSSGRAAVAAANAGCDDAAMAPKYLPPARYEPSTRRSIMKSIV
eukprot:1980328-Prymnesium_polylepis.1